MAQIIYCLIAKDQDNVLCDYALASGNFPQLSRTILQRHIKLNEKRMLQYDQKYIFHYQNEDGITVLALTETDFNKRVAFLFLDDVKKDFLKMHGEEYKGAISYEMKDYSMNLKEKMIYYNTNQNVDKLQATKVQIGQVKEVMLENLEKIQERGQKIEILVQKTQDMEDSAVVYRKSGAKLKRFMCMRDKKMMLLAIIVTVFLVGLLVLIIVLTIN